MNVGELMIDDWVYRVDFKEPIPVRISCISSWCKGCTWILTDKKANTRKRI